jgi:hypothetical protein
MWRIRKMGDENGYIVRNKELAIQLLDQFNRKGGVWEMIEITEYELGDPMEQ